MNIKDIIRYNPLIKLCCYCFIFFLFLYFLAGLIGITEIEIKIAFNWFIINFSLFSFFICTIIIYELYKPYVIKSKLKKKGICTTASIIKITNYAYTNKLTYMLEYTFNYKGATNKSYEIIYPSQKDIIVKNNIKELPLYFFKKYDEFETCIDLSELKKYKNNM